MVSARLGQLVLLVMLERKVKLGLLVLLAQPDQPERLEIPDLPGQLAQQV